MQDTLTEVYLVSAKAGSAELRRTNCVIVAPAIATKGLEFDVVVIVDPSGTWDDSMDIVSEREKNGLYVAVSRACHGLSFVTSGMPGFVADLVHSELCVLIDDEQHRSE